MTKTKFILALAFLLVFAAGAVVGMVRHRVGFGPHGPGGPGGDPRRDGGGSFLTRELGLSPDQQHKMKDIWSPMPALGKEHGERRREYQKQRDEAILALLNEEQKKKYDAIQKEYSDRLAELQQQRQQAFQQAVEQTKAILTPEQAAKYEEVLKKRPEGGPGGPGGLPWRDRRGPEFPSTRHAD